VVTVGLADVGRGTFAQSDGNKISQKSAKYRPQPHGIQRCEICVQFRPPNSCQLVSGEINPKGWCQYFAAKENAD
jgi:hypothetical protein